MRKIASLGAVLVLSASCWDLSLDQNLKDPGATVQFVSPTDGQLIPGGTLLAGWSALQASALAGEAALGWAIASAKVLPESSINHTLGNPRVMQFAVKILF